MCITFCGNGLSVGLPRLDFLTLLTGLATFLITLDFEVGLGFTFGFTSFFFFFDLLSSCLSFFVVFFLVFLVVLLETSKGVPDMPLFFLKPSKLFFSFLWKDSSPVFASPVSLSVSSAEELDELITSSVKG